MPIHDAAHPAPVLAHEALRAPEPSEGPPSCAPAFFVIVLVVAVSPIALVTLPAATIVLVSQHAATRAGTAPRRPVIGLRRPAPAVLVNPRLLRARVPQTKLLHGATSAFGVAEVLRRTTRVHYLDGLLRRVRRRAPGCTAEGVRRCPWPEDDYAPNVFATP